MLVVFHPINLACDRLHYAAVCICQYFDWLGVMKVIHSVLSLADHPPCGASQPTASRVSQAISFMNLHGCECEQQW